MLWLSLQPIPRDLPLLQQSPIDTTNYYITIPPLIPPDYVTILHYVTLSLLIPQAILFLSSYDTTTQYANILLLTQQAIRSLYPDRYNNLILLFKLFWYYTPMDTTISYVTIFLLIQQATMSLYSYWYNNLFRYYTPIGTARYNVTILPLIQQSYFPIIQLIQQAITSL